MKLRCLCDAIISDNTDFLPYEAWRVADQDWEDFLESKTPGGGLDWSLASTMYQCSKCGRLILEGVDRRPLFFKPEAADEEAKRCFGSVRGKQWKRFLVAIWDSKRKWKEVGKGHIEFPDFRGEGFERFDDYDAFEKR